jgi:hypothetical protein
MERVVRFASSTLICSALITSWDESAVLFLLWFFLCHGSCLFYSSWLAATYREGPFICWYPSFCSCPHQTGQLCSRGSLLSLVLLLLKLGTNVAFRGWIFLRIWNYWPFKIAAFVLLLFVVVLIVSFLLIFFYFVVSTDSICPCNCINGNSSLDSGACSQTNVTEDAGPRIIFRPT